MSYHFKSTAERLAIEAQADRALGISTNKKTVLLGFHERDVEGRYVLHSMTPSEARARARARKGGT